MSVVLLNIYIALAIAAGSVGADSVKNFALTKAVVQAQAQVTVACPAPAALARHPRPGLPRGAPIPLTGYRSW